MISTTDAFLVFLLILFSAVCSGLNISIMSLGLGELKRKARLGGKRAKRVLPLREKAHLTLAGILLCNVAFASGAAIVLGDNFNGFVAVAISTVMLVIFAELLPQALFTRQALTICSALTPLMRLFIIVTYPLSKPLQLALDRIFGPTDAGKLHTRRELGLMMKEHLGEQPSELDEDEVEIIQGALQLSEKQVTEIMTPIENAYWLRLDTVLDSQKINQIKAANYSRMPIFNAKLTKCHGVLLMKDMIDVDFRQRQYSVGDFQLHQTKLVGSRTALDTMFRKFISARSHLIPVEREDHIVGIVTIEDLLEEIIGHEIVDESDHKAARA